MVDFLLDLVLWFNILLKAACFATVHNGQVLKSRGDIFRAYLLAPTPADKPTMRGSFWLDFATVFPADFVYLATVAFTDAGGAKFTPEVIGWYGACRLGRLLALYQFYPALDTVKDAIEKRLGGAYIKSGQMELVKMLVTLLLAMHWLACIAGVFMLRVATRNGACSATAAHACSIDGQCPGTETCVGGIGAVDPSLAGSDAARCGKSPRTLRASRARRRRTTTRPTWRSCSRAARSARTTQTAV